MSMTLSTFDLFLVYLSYSRFVTKEISIWTITSLLKYHYQKLLQEQ
jgi:hypothetical protein